MQRRKALKLIKDWSNRLCIHPHLEEEYHMGKATGEKVCAVCGQTIYINIWGKESTSAESA